MSGLISESARSLMAHGVSFPPSLILCAQMAWTLYVGEAQSAKGWLVCLGLALWCICLVLHLFPFPVMLQGLIWVASFQSPIVSGVQDVAPKWQRKTLVAHPIHLGVWLSCKYRHPGWRIPLPAQNMRRVHALIVKSFPHTALPAIALVSQGRFCSPASKCS